MDKHKRTVEIPLIAIYRIYKRPVYQPATYISFLKSNTQTVDSNHLNYDE